MASSSSIYHLALLSAEIVSLSLVSITVHVYRIPLALHHTTLTWLQTPRTVRQQRLPLNLGKCEAQASSKLLNNQCVPMVTGTRTLLVGCPAWLPPPASPLRALTAANAALCSHMPGHGLDVADCLQPCLSTSHTHTPAYTQTHTHTHTIRHRHTNFSNPYVIS